MDIDRNEIVRLTETQGGEWGINHTRRLLHLVDCISDGQPYDKDVVWVAAHLHDWGGYGQWAAAGVDHAVRSVQVAETFLKEQNFPAEFSQRVLECIEFHHSPDPSRSIEAILLCDADALDFLGVVGVLRDFAKKQKDMRNAYDTTQKRRAKLPGKLILEKSKEIAAQRVQEMDDLLARFEAETFGCF